LFLLSTKIWKQQLSDSSLSKKSIIAKPVLNSFNDLTGWEDTQVGLQNYWIEDGNLTIYTNANTWERTKIKPFRLIQLALTRRIFIQMGVGDM
jgi:hypothetical protein